MTDPAPLAFIDTETTGVHPGRRPWEIAVIRRDETGERELLIQVSDVDLSDADPFGLKVGGFYDRHVAYGRENDGDTLIVREAEAAVYVEEWTRGAHLVGVVPSFDAETLDRMLRRHQLIPAWHYHLVDVEAMAVGWLHGYGAYPPRRWIAGVAESSGEPLPPSLMFIPATVEKVEFRPGPPPSELAPPWKSDELSELCHVDPPSDADRHTALGDARWAMRWYDALTGQASS